MGAGHTPVSQGSLRTQGQGSYLERTRESGAHPTPWQRVQRSKLAQPAAPGQGAAGIFLADLSHARQWLPSNPSSSTTKPLMKMGMGCDRAQGMNGDRQCRRRACHAPCSWRAGHAWCDREETTSPRPTLQHPHGTHSS